MQRLAGLPDFEYPVSLSVKNTFFHAEIGRPVSIEGFYEERRLQSCPVSAAYGPEIIPGNEEQNEQEADGGDWALTGLPCGWWAKTGDSPAARAPTAEEMEPEVCWAFATPESTPMMPVCRPVSQPLGAPAPLVGLPFGVPPPPLQPPSLPPYLPVQTAVPEASPSLPPVPSSAPGAPLLLLSDMLEVVSSQSPASFSVGSAEHASGGCKPCAHAFSEKGCRNGTQCKFCHICPPGELKRQQKAKRQAKRKVSAA